MRVGLITFHGSPRAPTSVCDHIELQTFFDGPVLRYAARLAGSAVICRSAYYLLGGALPSQHAVPSRPTGHLLRPTASRHRSWLHSFRNTQHRGPAACSRTKPLLCRCHVLMSSCAVCSRRFVPFPVRSRIHSEGRSICAPEKAPPGLQAGLEPRQVKQNRVGDESQDVDTKSRPKA